MSRRKNRIQETDNANSQSVHEISESDIQEETIDEYQDRMLEGFHCSEAIRNFVGKHNVGAIRELFYMLAIDGMKLEDLQKIENATEKMDGNMQYEVLKHERSSYMKTVFTDYGKIVKKVNEIHAAASTLMDENKQLAEKSVDSMRTALHLVVEEKNRLERSSQEEIRNLQKKIQEQENMIRYLQSAYVKNRDLSSDADDTCPSDSDSSKRGKRKGLFSILRKDSEDKQKNSMDLFIQEFIDSDKYKKDQVNFLLDCLDEGDQMEDMKQWAIPNVEVNVMRRLRSIYYKRKQVEYGDKGTDE